MRHLLLGLAFGLVAASPATADVLLLAPSDPLTPGDTVAVQVMFANSGDTTTNITVPVHIGYALTGDITATNGQLQLTDKTAAGIHTLNAGSFVQRTYELEVPHQWSGIGRLALTLPNSPQTLVEIAKPTVQFASQSGGVDPATPPSSEDDVCETCGAAPKESLPPAFQMHEPLYVLYGFDPGEIKLQFSFKYQLIDKSADPKLRWLNGFHFAYTQTSFWDVAAESRPFRDSSYRPELFYDFANRKNPESDLFPDLKLKKIRTGFVHESNGRAGTASRSMNYVYARPEFTFPLSKWKVNDGKREQWELLVAPKVWAYVGDRIDNQDIDDFRGNAELMLRLMRRELDRQSGPGIAATFRKGNLGSKGSVQLDASYPIPLDGTEIYPTLYAQLFTGYGESLLDYNKKDTRLRFGIGTRW